MIKQIDIENISLFEKASFEFSSGLNILVGKNSTGKTHLMKLIYAISKAYEVADNLEKNASKFYLPVTKELLKNFMVDRVGKLSSRNKLNNRSKITAYNNIKERTSLEFDPEQESVSISQYTQNFLEVSSVYIPTKEILTMYNGFISRYLEGELTIEKIYFDLAVKLGIPLKKKPVNLSKLIKPIEKMMQGKIIFDPAIEQFYLQQECMGRLEIGLVAEGYRKIGQILYLIANGILKNNTLLFLDEPEVNINPAYCENMAELLVELSKNLQIFIATHDYFLLKHLDLAAKMANTNIKFFSLHKNKDTDQFVQVETSNNLDELEHNPILQEFEAVYQKLSKVFYE